MDQTYINTLNIFLNINYIKDAYRKKKFFLKINYLYHKLYIIIIYPIYL